MDMLDRSRSLTADEAMNMPERSLTTDEDMEMERFFLTFSNDNGVAQSADASVIWLLQLLSGQQQQQHNSEEEEEDDDGQDDDDPEFVGDPTEETTVQGNNYFNSVVILNLLAQQLEVDFETVLGRVFGGGAYGDGGAVVVPASDAAVASLEKQAFHATAEGRRDSDSECGVTGCAICLEEFEDGEEVTVMPCSRGHAFHSGCITEWLGKSNTCPLCRHALPTDLDDGP